MFKYLKTIFKKIVNSFLLSSFEAPTPASQKIDYGVNTYCIVHWSVRFDKNLDPIYGQTFGWFNGEHNARKDIKKIIAKRYSASIGDVSIKSIKHCDFPLIFLNDSEKSIATKAVIEIGKTISELNSIEEKRTKHHWFFTRTFYRCWFCHAVSDTPDVTHLHWCPVCHLREHFRYLK